MKLPTSLSKGLTDEERQRLESDLKHGIAIRKLRETLEHRIRNTELMEESFTDPSVAQLASQLGERRGYRAILELLNPE